tara:strand:+ start:214 stop:495 length:282 start_codon:yes stop_codon:yes gene_type:complete
MDKEEIRQIAYDFTTSKGDAEKLEKRILYLFDVMLCYVDTYSANGYPTFKKGKFYPIEKSYLKGLLIMRNEQGINTKMSGEYWETIKDNFNKV